MCFIKTSKPKTTTSSSSTSQAQEIKQVVEEKPQDSVLRQEANADLTKNSKTDNLVSGYNQNIKTSALDLETTPDTLKKTLLGE